jgi:hypothetical protein
LALTSHHARAKEHRMQTDPYPSPTIRMVRRLAGALLLGGLAFFVLWLTVFNAVSAALVGAGIGGGAIIAGSSSDVFGGLLEAVLDAIAGVISAIASLFTDG